MPGDGKFVARGSRLDGAADEGTTEKPHPYTVLISRRARRNLSENLPLEVAIAATETIQHAIALKPARVGKPLDEPFDGYYSARRGTYRIIYRIDEAKQPCRSRPVPAPQWCSRQCIWAKSGRANAADRNPVKPERSHSIRTGATHLVTPVERGATLWQP